MIFVDNQLAVVNGTWYVYSYSLLLIEAWIFAQVDDRTSEILVFDENHPSILPTMTIEEIRQIVKSSSNYTTMLNDVSKYFEYYYFIRGKWYYFVQGTTRDGQYVSITVIIDDKTQSIDEIYRWTWEIIEPSSYSNGQVSDASGEDTVKTIP